MCSRTYIEKRLFDMLPKDKYIFLMNNLDDIPYPFLLLRFLLISIFYRKNK